MTPRAGLGAASLVAGLAIVVLAQLGGRLAGPPLFDGVVPAEPYRWLDPPPDHPGGAQGANATVPVKGGQSDLIAVATPEMSPQAQIFATPGSLNLPSAARSVMVSIQPVPPPGPLPSGYIDGNVYRIAVTDQTGTPLTAPESAKVSIVLRSADPNLGAATIERFDGSSWAPLATSPAGAGSFLAVVTAFGDFAVVASGTSPYATVEAASGQGSSAAPTSEESVQGAASTAPTSGASASPPPVTGSGGIPPTIFLIAAVLAVIAMAAVTVIAPTRPSSPRGRRRR